IKSDKILTEAYEDIDHQNNLRKHFCMTRGYSGSSFYLTDKY
ncbi:6560_t:CDS:1, partial [Entrophospora sp. SA101]